MHKNNTISFKLKDYIVLFILICLFTSSYGQQPTPVLNAPTPEFLPDTIPNDILDTDNPGLDSTIDIPISDQALDDGFESGAVESRWIDIVNNEVHLRGDAFIKYQETEIKAGYIIFNLDKKEALAQAVEGQNGEAVGKPVFISNGQEIQYNKLRFNFETQKGIVYEAFSRQGEFFVHGAITKFVSKAGDSLYVDDVIFNKDALITTCDHPHPHYGIRASKLKLIPDKLAVIGPSRMEIAGIPTPLFIPFALAPLIQGQRSGIIFGGQQGFEISERLGFGFREIGYYWALSDYLDLKVTGDIYSRGSYGLRVASNYAKRYKYRGNVNIGFSNQFNEFQGELNRLSNKSFTFGLTHNQDSKAHPYVTIGGNLRFTTNDFDRVNFNDAQSQLENIINSNFRISHSLPQWDALSLNITIGHTQNTRTRKIDFTLPNIQLRMKRINPFKRKVATGKEKWYEKINVGYNSQLRNFVSTVDTTLLTRQTLDNLQSGISHEAQASATFNLLNHFQFTPSVNYDEFWVLQTLDREFLEDSISVSTNPFTGERDTTQIVIADRINTGFDSYRDYNASANLSTNLFGTLLFAKGRLRGLRHTIKPSIGFSFQPSTEGFVETVRDDLDDPDSFQEFTRFDGGIFQRPQIRENQAALTYSILNNFEGKWFSKKDSTVKVFKIFNTISANGNYNFTADSLKWSPVSLGGNASLFKRISNLTFRATLDPLEEIDNRRVNTTVWAGRRDPDGNRTGRRRLLRLENFASTLTTRFSIKDVREFLSKRKNKRDEDDEDEDDGEFVDNDLLLDQQENEFRNQPFGSSRRDDFVDFEGEPRSLGDADDEDNGERSLPSFWEMFDQFSVSHAITYGIQSNDGDLNSEIMNNSLRFSGRIQLTDNWNVNVGNFSYDFVSKRFVFPSLGFSRNLHCWNMRFDWQPARGTFNFIIAVNSSQLGNFLKYNYGQNQFDSIF